MLLILAILTLPPLWSRNPDRNACALEGNGGIDGVGIRLNNRHILRVPIDTLSHSIFAADDVHLPGRATGSRRNVNRTAGDGYGCGYGIGQKIDH